MTTVYEAQLQVMADIQPIQKEFVKQLGYSAMMYEHLVSAIKPILVRNNLLFTMVRASLIHEDTVKASSGRDMRHVTVECQFKLRLADDPEDSVNIVTLGEAIDHSDKACGKATTYAAKYALRLLFLLEYDDDDPDRTAPERGTSDVRKERALVAIRTAETIEEIDKLWRAITDPSVATFTATQAAELKTALAERRTQIEAATSTD